MVVYVLYAGTSLLCLLPFLDIGVLGLTCLYCDSVALPNLCRTITRCQSDEVCELVEYVTSIGAIRYRQKCVKKQVCTSRKRDVIGKRLTEQEGVGVSCVTCCASDLCNAGGCSQTGFQSEVKGHVCYSCDTQIGSDMCDRIEQCGRDQICQVTPSNVPGAPKNLYRTGCQHPGACVQTLTLIGRKRTAWNTCCNGTLCNDYDPIGNCPRTTSLPPRSTAPTTVARTTTRAGTSVAGGLGDCKDSLAVCPKAYCDLQAYKAWAKDNCKKTCGLCTGGIATTGPQQACRDVASGCSTSLCTTYHSWSKQNCKKTCGYCTGHVSANKGDEWLLLLKAVAGVSSNSDIYHLWSGNMTMNAKIPAYSDLTDTFKAHFKPDYSNHWDRMRFDKVKVSMYVNGTERAFITFNTTGLDKVSWFRADRVIDSTWGQHPRQGHFQIDVSRTTGLEFNARSTLVTGCDVTGWMTVASNANCVSSKLHFPAFLFCPGHHVCRWSQGHFEPATVFAIHGHSTV